MSDSTPPTPRSKRATRQTLRARRDSLTPTERAAASAAIARAVNEVVARRLGPRDVLAVYAAKGTEVETSEIAAHAARLGIRVAYPRVVDGDRTLAFHEVNASELLAPSRYGLREPAADAPSIALGSIGAFVIPGLAFDLSGGRIGWGMGHYDATLAKAPHALRMGIAFDCQIVDHVPQDAHDIALQYVITEIAAHAMVNRG